MVLRRGVSEAWSLGKGYCSKPKIMMVSWWLRLGESLAECPLGEVLSLIFYGS